MEFEIEILSKNIQNVRQKLRELNALWYIWNYNRDKFNIYVSFLTTLIYYKYILLIG